MWATRYGGIAASKRSGMWVLMGVAWGMVLTGCSTQQPPSRQPSVAAACPASALIADGSVDVSPALQQALDAQAQVGGRVFLPPGRYRLDHAITIPEGVTLAGTWNGPHHAQLNHGTVLHVYADANNEAGPALISMMPSTTVEGITFFYPDQRIPGTLAYPWTIQGRGMHNNVIDCTFVNAYKAINFGQYPNELHYVRNCFGCPLKVGISVDKCTDIGRIENVHFNPHYWGRANVAGVPVWEDLLKYLWENLVAFDFARTDWEYVANTFCFGAKVGYRFHKSEAGTVNGNFLGIGADWCHRALLVEESQPPGLLITNGEFVGGQGSDAIIEMTASHTGLVQMSNCAFWGPTETAVIADGTGTLSLNQCNFANQIGTPGGAYILEARGGQLSVQNCRFTPDRKDIRMGSAVSTAIVMGNSFKKTQEIDSAGKTTLQQGLNLIVP